MHQNMMKLSCRNSYFSQASARNFKYHNVNLSQSFIHKISWFSEECMLTIITIESFVDHGGEICQR